MEECRMKKWPPDYFDDNWNSYSKSVGPAEVDEYRKDAYLSHESFLRSVLAKLNEQRPSLWKRDYSSPEAYEKSTAEMRSSLKKMLGFWQEPAERAPLRVWDYEPLIETDDFIARRFKIEVTPGLETYGISLAPRTTGPHPGLLAQHGYAGTPELICGLAATSGDPNFGYRSAGLRAVLRGFYVVAINHPLIARDGLGDELAETLLLRFLPSGLPVQPIQMNDLEIQNIAQPPRQRELARSGAADDRDAIHRRRYAS
jgi:hypothetical protein